MKKIQKYSTLALLGSSLALAGSACAEEGGSGHYMPGSMASFIDSVPPAPAFLMRLNLMNYDASAAKNIQLPLAGLIVSGADIAVTGAGLTMVWRPESVDLGKDWSYAMSTTIPVLTIEVNASAATLNGNPSLTLSDDESGLGDIIIQPLMLSHTINPDFKFNTRLTMYAPTGKYTAGKLANTGKNFWTFSPSAEFMYFGQENGIEGSLFMGLDMNVKNPDTEYRSGMQAHIDGTLAQHFPIWGGLAGAGVSAYYYKQITGDGGAGASFGDFKAMTTGSGPALSFSKKLGTHSITSELKWLHEMETEKRVKGDIIFFKLLSNF